MKRIKNFLSYLQKFSDRSWYPSLVAGLALSDCFILIVPTDGILVSSVLMNPKKWLRLALWTTVGSTLGAGLLAWTIESYGMGFIFKIYPDLMLSSMWIWTENFFNQYGLLVVLLVAASPLAQHPAIVLAALSGANIFFITGVVLLGRLVKYVFIAYISSHMPHLLKKMWGLQGELKEVGVIAEKPHQS